MNHVKGVETPPARFFERPALPSGVTSVDAELTPGDRLGDMVRDEYHLGCTPGPKLSQPGLNALYVLRTCQEHDIMPQLSQTLGGAPAVQGLASSLGVARVSRNHDSNWLQTRLPYQARELLQKKTRTA